MLVPNVAQRHTWSSITLSCLPNQSLLQLATHLLSFCPRSMNRAVSSPEQQVKMRLLMQTCNTCAFVISNSFIHHGTCDWFHPIVSWCNFIQWTCWNTVCLPSLPGSHSKLSSQRAVLAQLALASCGGCRHRCVCVESLHSRPVGAGFELTRMLVPVSALPMSKLQALH